MRCRQKDSKITRLESHCVRTHTENFPPCFVRGFTSSSPSFPGYSLESCRKWGCIPANPLTPPSAPSWTRVQKDPQRFKGMFCAVTTLGCEDRQRTWTTGMVSSNPLRGRGGLRAGLTTHTVFFFFFDFPVLPAHTCCHGDCAHLFLPYV